MIKAKPWDIGRTVIFRPKRTHSLGGFKSADLYASEEGVLQALDWNNGDTVVVKFPGDTETKRVKTDMLFWKDS